MNPTYAKQSDAAFPIQVNEEARTVRVQSGITQRILLDYLANYTCAQLITLSKSAAVSTFPGHSSAVKQQALKSPSVQEPSASSHVGDGAATDQELVLHRVHS